VAQSSVDDVKVQRLYCTTGFNYSTHAVNC